MSESLAILVCVRINLEHLSTGTDVSKRLQSAANDIIRPANYMADDQVAAARTQQQRCRPYGMDQLCS